MKKLKTVLQETSNRRFKAGGSMSQALLDALRAHRRSRSRIFVILLAALVAAVSVSLVLIVRFAGDAGSLSALAAAIGLSVGGCVELLRRVWHEWSQADLLLILAEDASEAQITALIDKLIEKL